MLGRLRGAWRALDRDQRWAGVAAVALLATMFLPWYQKSVAVGRDLASENLKAFGVFTFVEAAILLVALGVFVLLFARGEKKGFHLPGGDGTVIFAAGAWAALLLLWRVFDRPDVEGQGATIGITWGFFFAFLAAAALAATGWRIRAAGRPEPPLVREREEPPTAATEVAPRRRSPRRPPPEAEQLTLDEAAEAPTRAAPRDADPAEAPTRAAPRERRAPDAAPPDEPLWSGPSDAPTRAVPREEDRPAPREDRRARRERPAWEDDPAEGPTRAAPRDDRPSPPPIRPGVFDQAADDDEPLRPGEIPRAPDRDR